MKDSRTPASNGTKPLLSSKRRFQVWRYTVSHSQLLLRANPDPSSQERIEVLFKGVDWFQLPSVLDGLTVIEDPGNAAFASVSTMPPVDPSSRTFRLEGLNYRGVIVCVGAFVNVDTRSYSDPSAFADSLMM
jgi:hypothetical protein